MSGEKARCVIGVGCLLLVGCTSTPATDVPPSAVNALVVITTNTPPATADEWATFRADTLVTLQANRTVVAQTPTTTPWPTAAYSVSPETPQLTAPAGLVYTMWPGGLWRINSAGQPVELIPHGSWENNHHVMDDIDLSADQQQVVYTLDHSDVWLTDLQTGNSRNLTNTPDVKEFYPQWWNARPGVIAFYVSMDDEMARVGHPAIINADGSGYRVFDNVLGNVESPLALSPDGETLATESATLSDGLLYPIGGPLSVIGEEVFGEMYNLIGYPEWSPDGRLLAWSLVKKGDWFGTGIYDPLQQRGYILKNGLIAGGSDFSGSLAWSPDGQWLVHSFPPQGWWVMRVDGSEQHELAQGGSLVSWSPDGRQLIGMTREGEYQVFAWGEWQQSQSIYLPPDVYIVDWVAVKP